MNFTRKLSNKWGLTLAANGLYSPNELPTSERFYFGGRYFGRAYNPAILAGDSGLATKMELERRLPRIPPVSAKLRAYSYYDFGVAWKNTELRNEKRRSASSIGIGLRWSQENADLYVEVGKPLTLEESRAAGKDPRLFFGVLIGF